ncbi:MAG: hypothetical protein D6734_07720, partial [Candidatus Schekmanbacteria bacterium]
KKTFFFFFFLALTSFLLLSSYQLSAIEDNVGVQDVSTFEFDLKDGAGAEPGKNWYSIDGGAAILHLSNKKNLWKKIKKMKKPGDVFFGPVTIEGPMLPMEYRTDLLSILNDWARSQGTRWNSTLTLQDSSRTTLRTIHFKECIPLSYTPPSVRAGDSSLLEEEFVFKPMIVEEVAGSIPTKNKSIGNYNILQGADPIDLILTSDTFGFEINGQELSVLEVIPGRVSFKLSRAKVNKKIDNHKWFTIIQVDYGEWEVKKHIIKGDTLLRTLFENFAKGTTGAEGSPSGINATLSYHDRAGMTKRTIYAHNIIPVSYESAAVDSRNGTVATESLRFRVEYCTFE